MKYDIFSKKSIVITLVVLGVLTHAAWFGHPNSAVFDEVHFGKFISAYFTHEYYFDIHPPLGKLVLAAWGWLWDFRPGFSFANIGEVYPDNLYMALRFLPMLAGALLPLVIFGVARQLKLSRAAATLAGILVALDNALLVQSRLILLDSFLLLFGFGALWCYLRSRSLLERAVHFRRQAFFLVCAGLLGGAAMSIKWTGITFLALMIILEIVRLWSARRAPAGRYGLQAFSGLVIVPALFYLAVFAMHFSLLTRAGAGDAFMSTRFQSTLTGNRYADDSSLSPIGPFEKTVELNTEMYRSNQRLTATHPYSSKWYTWPFMVRPIFYWVHDNARIYLLGNPLVWWGSTVAVLVMFLTLAFSGVRLPAQAGAMSRTPLIMTGGWLMNIIPFIGISRVMFLYHYFTALIWAILMLAYHTRKAVIGISLAALVLFIFFAPLSYGLPLTDSSYNTRVWFSSWR